MYVNPTVHDPIVSICSPVHNEEDNLRELANRIAAAMDTADVGSWECIMIDDGSTILRVKYSTKSAPPMVVSVPSITTSIREKERHGKPHFAQCEVILLA